MSPSDSTHEDPAPSRRGLTRDPTAAPSSTEGRADEFCRFACLVYSELDGPDRWARARELLAAHPEIVDSSIAAAAAAADPAAIAAHLTADPTSASTPTGPHRWAPLLYLTYSRVHGPEVPQDRFIRSVQLLLDAGADPNAGYLWRGLIPPFTALTGVFGEGEQGAGRQPRHPYSDALGRLLLTAGADPSDGQTLYNRMFRPDDGHLVLLFEYGLGRAPGPWASLLGPDLDSPTRMLAGQLGWAIDHGFADRVELLIANGVDVIAPLPDGRTPAEHAATAGYREIIADLRIAGAAVPDSPELELIGALLAADTEKVEQHRTLLNAARSARPDLVHQVRDPRAVAVLAAAGFDLDARRDGRSALHEAAFAGDTALLAALLAAGADPAITDSGFGATAAGWAQYACQPGAAALLATISPER